MGKDGVCLGSAAVCFCVFVNTQYPVRTYEYWRQKGREGERERERAIKNVSYDLAHHVQNKNKKCHSSPPHCSERAYFIHTHTYEGCCWQCCQTVVGARFVYILLRDLVKKK